MAMGAYAAWDNRSWDRMEQFQRTVGRLAFAGEHTAGPDHHGTMEGALRSGVRAAAQVHRDARLTAPRSEPIRCSPVPTSGRAENRDERGRPMADAAVDEPLVLIEDIGPVRRLTMNRPGALNALSAGLIAALSTAFHDAGRRPRASA